MSLLLALALATGLGARVDEWEHYTHYGNVSALQILPDQNLAIGTSGGLVIASCDGAWQVDSIWNYPGRLSHSLVRTLHLDSGGSIWVGTYGGGIDVVHPDGSSTHYGQLEGLPLDQEITDILVDSVVWAGTTEGLAIRELSYFVTWDTYSTGGGLPSSQVNCVSMADSGLVVGTGGGAGAVMLLAGADPGDSDSWRQYDETSGLTFNDLLSTPDTIWAATDGGLYFLTDTVWTEDTTFPSDFAQSLDVSGEEIAVGGQAELLLRSAGIWSSVTPSAFIGANVYDVCWAGSDSLIVGRGWQLSTDRAAGPGIVSGYGDEWSSFLPPGAPSNDLISVCLDHDGNCWVGGQGNGAGVLHSATVEWTTYRSELSYDRQLFACVGEPDGGVFIAPYHFGVTWIDWKGTPDKSDDDILILTSDDSGLLNDQVLSMDSHPYGIWFTHEPYFETPSEPSGVSRLQWTPGDLASASWDSWTTSSGIPSAYVGAIEASSSDLAWVGTAAGLVLLNAGTGEIWPGDPIDSQDGLPADSVTGLAETPAGALYIGTSGGLALLPEGSGTAVEVEDIDGAVRCLATDHLSNVWIGTEGNLYQIELDGNVETYSILNSPLLDASIRGLAVDADGGYVYAATSRGLWRLGLGSGLAEQGEFGPTLYPNPFIPDGQNVLRVAGLPNEPTTVEVFDLRAELVYQSLTPDRDSFAWTGLDESGDVVAAGTYIVRIQQEGTDCLFKLAVVR